LENNKKITHIYCPAR